LVEFVHILRGHQAIWLIDNTNEHFTVQAYVSNSTKSVGSFSTEKECIDYLKEQIICTLKREGYRSREGNIGY
jgi:hypothetical protein